MSKLETYQKKRDFGETNEPKGSKGKSNGSHRLAFVVQKHDAKQLHYDFRLEWDGALKSWSVPKGPSDDPGDKRLAVQVEDHPLDYADFEGRIPKGEYGAGNVIVWDAGEWEIRGRDDPGKALKRGRLKFTLRGDKLHGDWALVRMKGKDKKQWLLIKSKDVFKVAHIRITNPDRRVFPDANISKGEVAEYYASVASRLLPHIAERSLSIVRCPKGRDEQCFYQKHRGQGMPKAVGAVKVPETNGKKDYLTVDSTEGLAALVQFGMLEIHPWLARNDRLYRPDLMVFDLDPAEDAPWKNVVEAAYAIRDILRDLELESFPKITGGKGIHVVAPLTRRYHFDAVKDAAKAIVRRVRDQDPDHYTLAAAKEKRKGKIFLDYLRNARGATAVAPYSLRARKGAPVATPLGWDEIKPSLRPDHYTMKTMQQRLSKLKNDPWKEFFKIHQSLRTSALRSLGVKGF